MTVKVQQSQKQVIAQNIGMLELIIIMILFTSVAAVIAFGQGLGSQQSQSQPQPSPSPTPRPAITQVSSEDASRELNNPRSKWFREAKFGLLIHLSLWTSPPKAAITS